MITAIDPASFTSSSSYAEKPKLPPGKHILRCVRLLESKKDGSHYTDKDGDRKCLAIFESDSYPDHEAIFQAVYDSRHSITTDREAKLARTADFVGKFLHCAGISQISSLDEMVELSAYANVVRNGKYTNIKNWVTPEPVRQPAPPPREEPSRPPMGAPSSPPADDDVPF